MAATVQLCLGDMFEGPSDLIVVPCSTLPTISDFVQQRLQRFDIPQPSRPMQLGETEIRRFAGAENVAPYVAFAASVQGARSTTPEAIREIGASLGQFTRQEPGVRVVTAPLLGTGAGGLTAEVAADQLSSGFLGECSDDASLRLYVLGKEEFDRLQGSSETVAEAEVSEPIRVFFSYTHTSEEHRQWVRDLATFLRLNGIEARLDRWHLHEGMDVVQWMCNELDLADRVLLICNEEYAERADRRHGGVGWEVKIVQGDMYSAPPESDKYLPVIRCDNPNDGLPSFLKTSLFVHWPPAADGFEQRKRILESIYRVQEEPPPIGKPPAFVLGHRGSTRPAAGLP